MKNFATRLAIVIGVVLAVHTSMYLVRSGMRAHEVVLPRRALSELPYQLGDWQGEDAELDPKLFLSSEAHEAVARTYVKKEGNKITVFLAQYLDPARGLYHSPGNCYRANGWAKLQEVRVPLKSEHRPEISVSLSTWELNDKKILVLYWYELDQYTLFERLDLGKVHWALRGREAWPPVHKVLLQTALLDRETSETQLKQIAAQIRDWLGTLDDSPASPTPPQTTSTKVATR